MQNMKNLTHNKTLQRCMNLRGILENYIQGVSKSKLHISSRAIDALKTLDYHHFVTVIQQFEPELCCVCVEDYIQLSSTDIMKVVERSNYKDYPVTIKQVSQDTTELIAMSPMNVMDTLICLPPDSVLFAPVVAEFVARDSMRRLHEMTLVFDTQNNVVFLHDPNGRSLFNDNNTHTLLRNYTEILNCVLVEYGLVPFTYDVYAFSNMNTKVNHFFSKSVTGNCVIASIVFMLLYHKVRDATILTPNNNNKINEKKDYTCLYTAFYNKIEEYLTLTGVV
jgi:hypothetical protein